MRQKIDCVSIATIHHFPGNLVADQHRMRKRIVIDHYEWGDLFNFDEMEYDQFDNLATEYFVARNEAGKIVGVMRTHPTTIPYMLRTHFNYLATNDLPQDRKIDEASRLVIDIHALPTREMRKPIVDALVLAMLERGVQLGKTAYVGFMLPKIWENTFLRTGSGVTWLGPEFFLQQAGYPVRAGNIPVSQEEVEKVRKVTGITWPVLNFGSASPRIVKSASYSHMEIHNES